MEGFKYTFIPHPDEEEHVGYNDLDEVAARVIEHMMTAARSLKCALSMVDGDFGKDPNNLMTGVVIMAHPGQDDVKNYEDQKKGFMIGAVAGLTTLEFATASPLKPSAWGTSTDEAFQPYERAAGRLH
jgi:hypothetical protein